MTSEERKAYQREWARAHPRPPMTDAQREKKRAYDRDRYLANKAKAKDSSRLVYERKRSEYIERAARWSAEHPEKRREISAKYKREHPEKARELVLRKYGLTLDDERRMYDAQGGGCAICGAREKLCVDHCHASGRVRRLLCKACNSGLGMFRDRPDLLMAAAAYLEKHRQRGDGLESAA